MNCRIYRLGTRQVLDQVEFHVLAKAYHAAWLYIHGKPPEREHLLPRLGLLLDFDAADGGDAGSVRLRG